MNPRVEERDTSSISDLNPKENENLHPSPSSRCKIYPPLSFSPCCPQNRKASAARKKYLQYFCNSDENPELLSNLIDKILEKNKKGKWKLCQWFLGLFQRGKDDNVIPKEMNLQEVLFFCVLLSTTNRRNGNTNDDLLERAKKKFKRVVKVFFVCGLNEPRMQGEEYQDCFQIRYEPDLDNSGEITISEDDVNAFCKEIPFQDS